MVDLEREFQSPSSGFRGVPFWAWNGKLEKGYFARAGFGISENGIWRLSYTCTYGIGRSIFGNRVYGSCIYCCRKSKRV